jgi:hypothetical protein
MTSAGADLYNHIEDLTDDAAAAAWCDRSETEELLSATKPFVKSVIDSGILPGTTKK